VILQKRLQFVTDLKGYGVSCLNGRRRAITQNNQHINEGRIYDDATRFLGEEFLHIREKMAQTLASFCKKTGASIIAEGIER
jgi:hypothetical protein